MCLAKDLAIALVNGDINSFAKLLSEDATWRFPFSLKAPMGGLHQSKKKIVMLAKFGYGKIFKQDTMEAEFFEEFTKGKSSAVRFLLKGVNGKGYRYENEHVLFVKQNKHGLASEVVELFDTKANIAQHKGSLGKAKM